MANLIDWSDDLSVQFSGIDDQHKELIILVNKLNNAMAAGKGNVIMGRLLSELIKYTAGHFEYEEKMMRDLNYSGYKQHKAEHDELVNTVVDLQTKFEAGDTRMSIEVMSFLKQWLQTHILGTDMKLGPFLASRM